VNVGNGKECNEGIGTKKWDKYFREVLGGVDGRMIYGEREREREREREGDRKRSRMWIGGKAGEC